MSQSSDFKFDIRVQSRMLVNGQLVQKDLDARLAALPDVSSQGVVLGIAAPGVGAYLGSEAAQSTSTVGMASAAVFGGSEESS